MHDMGRRLSEQFGIQLESFDHFAVDHSRKSVHRRPHEQSVKVHPLGVRFLTATHAAQDVPQNV
jgi:hypothetical protein